MRKFVYERRRQLKLAFDVLKVWHQDKWVVTAQRWQILLKKVSPKLSAPKVALLWEVLDNDGDGYIGEVYCSFIDLFLVFTHLPLS